MLLPLALALAALAGPPAVTVPTGAVNGRPVLGRTVPQVLASLGPASSVERFPNRRDLVYGPRARPRVEVIFAGPFARPDAERAWAILVADPATTVPRLGPVLQVAPAVLGQRLARLGLRPERAYRCDRRGCFGTLFSRDGRRRVIYGVQHGGRYLGVQVWPNP